MGSNLVGQLRHVWWARKLPAGHASLLVRDLLNLPGRHRSKRDPLNCAIQWLCLAQDSSGGGGVCGLYDLFHGWSGPYPETTGYIVPTFLRAGDRLNRPDLAVRARRMLDWLLSTQLGCGAFPAGISSGAQPQEPRVFNTGQIIQGLLAGFRYFSDARYLGSAIRAADWLCDIQDADGAWRTASYGGFPHAYHSRVSWPLIALGLETNRDRYLDAAQRNLDWVLSQQQPDGWFRYTEMVAGETVHLHPIAYTLRGLWESGVLLVDETYRNAVLPGVDRLLLDAECGRLAGAYREGWRRTGNHLCLTGHAQMAGLWFRMYRVLREPRLLAAAIGTLDILRELIDLDNPSETLRGGLRGSYPVTGAYMPLSIVNWGTKFLVDALLMERDCVLPAEVPIEKASARPAEADEACLLVPA